MSESDTAAAPLPTAVTPLLLDTSMITSDLISVVQGGREPWVPLVVPQDAIRCFTTHRVWAEVPRVLRQRHAKPDSRPFDLHAAERLWWEQYLPSVHVVTVESLAPATIAARALMQRDPTDAATAMLADLLGAVVVMADDKDLRPWVGASWRRTTYPAARVVAEGDAFAEGASTAVALGGHAVVGTARALADVAARRPLLVVGLAAAAALAAYWQRDRLASLAGTVRELGAHTLTAAGGRVELERAARATLRDAAHHEPAEILIARTARVLAWARAPLTRTDLARALRAAEGGAELGGHRQVMAELREVLNATALFHEPTPGHWQLGRRNVGATLYQAPVPAP